MVDHEEVQAALSARLDGAVTLDSLRSLIEDSYLLTASTATKKALRPPKE